MTQLDITRLIPAQAPSIIGAAGKVALIALGTDVSSETELRKYFPAGVDLYTNRVRFMNPATIENLLAMQPDIARAAIETVPDLDLDVIIYGCTSGAIVIGEQAIFDIFAQARGAQGYSTPITAALLAFKALSAQKISVLTPYIPSVNAELARYFSARGLNILNIAGLNIANDVEMAAVSEESLFQAGLQACHADADVLFISCTALRVANVIQRLEHALCIPVVVSNQALAWHSLEIIGKPYQVEGYGSLFSKRLVD